MYSFIVNKKFICSASFSLFLHASFFAKPVDVSKLLQGYLKNNIALQKLANEKTNAVFSEKISKIDNGLFLSLSTGTVTVRTSGKNAGTRFSPNAALAIRQANDLRFFFNTDVEVSATVKKVTNSEVGAEAELIPQTKRKVALIQKERETNEAERALANGFLSAESAFYEKLKSLYNRKIAIAEAQKDLYNDKLSLEELRARGYDETSSKYRSLSLKAANDEQSIEANTRVFSAELAIFLKQCGYAPTNERENADDAANENSLEDFLPLSVPHVDAITTDDFPKEAFSEIEEANWRHYFNSLSRKSEKSVSVKANASYTFQNSETTSDSFNTGASLSWSGFSAGLGISLPTAHKSETSSPVFTFSLAVNPFDFMKTKLKREQKKTQENQDALSVSDAEQKYEEKMIIMQNDRSTMLWQKEMTAKNFSLYSELESDNKKFLEAGIISESEYRASLANKIVCHYKMLINDIDIILFNNQTKILFSPTKKIGAKNKVYRNEKK